LIAVVSGSGSGRKEDVEFTPSIWKKHTTTCVNESVFKVLTLLMYLV
jgi:hypothetical protein